MTGVTLQLPPWLACLDQPLEPFACVEARMHQVIGLARENVQRQTGGPFGAAVFDSAGRSIAWGVNLVEQGQCSILHAEMVALVLAQQRLGRYDLSSGGQLQYELVTSTEPCAMCLGAIPWSGIKRVVCGARDEDARAIGFDEGVKPADWVGALTSRGIEVVRDVLRDEAVSVLRAYRKRHGLMYNAGLAKED